MKQLAAGILAIAFSVCAAAQTDLTKVFEARVYTSASGERLAYRLFRPAGYDSSREYPLVVYLHGGGGRGEGNLKQLQGGNAWGLGRFSGDEVQQQYPSFVLAPQANKAWGGGVRPDQETWDRTKQSVRFSPGLKGEPIDLLVELIESLRKEFSLDDRRFYVTGQSMGGYGAWGIITKYPKLFAAAAPICGGGDPSAAGRIEAPVWAFHGDADPTVPVEQSRLMIEALEAAGKKPRYTEFPGVRHNSWENAYADPELVEWMFAQRRR